jgi:hypothetical protein
VVSWGQTLLLMPPVTATSLTEWSTNKSCHVMRNNQQTFLDSVSDLITAVG